MNEALYEKSQVVATWNEIEVFSIDGKFGLFNHETDVFIKPIYDSIDWDKGTDFVVVSQGDNVGFLSDEDGHFIDFYDYDTHAPLMMAIPHMEYMCQVFPEWMLSFN